MINIRSVVCCVFAACVLNSCYTNVNQLWIKGKREYEVCHFDYYSDPIAGIKGLPPRLYKCGADWYIAARYMRLSDSYPYNCVQRIPDSFEERHGFEATPDAPVYYHKITPELADMLLHSDQECWKWFSKDKMLQELTKAGGEWLPALPAGAKPHSAIFLEYCRRDLLVTEEHIEPLPWYTYPAMGLTFLCVDVPASAVCISGGVLAGMGMSVGSISLDGGGSFDDDGDMDSMPMPEKAVRRDKSSHHGGGGHAHHHSGFSGSHDSGKHRSERHHGGSDHRHHSSSSGKHSHHSRGDGSSHHHGGKHHDSNSRKDKSRDRD